MARQWDRRHLRLHSAVGLATRGLECLAEPSVAAECAEEAVSLPPLSRRRLARVPLAPAAAKPCIALKFGKCRPSRPASPRSKLGMDHKKLTYYFNGRNMRLTDVAGELVPQITGTPKKA